MSALPYKLVPYLALLAATLGLLAQPAQGSAYRACVKTEATERVARRLYAAAHDAGADSHGALEITDFCNELRKNSRDYATEPESGVTVEVEQDVYRIWLFDYAGVSFDFRREDTADPANASGCWAHWAFI